MKELFEQVLATEATKNQWRNKYDSIEFKNASKLSKLLLGVHLNQTASCQCVEDLFFYMNRKKQTIMNKFKLKKGLVVTSFLHSTLTEFSSDTEFIQALKVSPASIKYFVEFPENWEQIVKGEEPIPSVATIKSELKELGVEVPKGLKKLN